VLLPTSSTTFYNANNQISSTTLGSVQYNPAGGGGVTLDNQNQYLYDGDGRICAVRNLMSGTMTGYVFDADGTRVSTGTIATWGSCDPSINGYQAVKDSILGPMGGQLTETGIDAYGKVVWAHTNVWAGGKLLATYDPNGIHFYITDWAGSRRVQTDYQGVVEQTCGNLPYGDGVTCGPNPAEDLYAGLDRDSESGLDHAMYRQYSSTFGRWTTPDPYGGSYDFSNPQSFNRYAYVNGSPLGATDRSGLDPIFDLGFSNLAPVATSDSFLTTLLGDIGAYAGPIGMLADVGDVFYDIGQSLGWWGRGPTFSGSVGASQSGKQNVAMAQAFVPEEDSSAEPGETAWGSPLEALRPLEPGEMVPGLPPNTWNTLTEPGPLEHLPWIINSFSGQQYTKFVIPEGGFGMDAYRVWGGNSTEEGSPDGVFLSPVPQVGGIQSLLENAILPRWNNATNVQCVFLPPGTVTYVGISAAQGGAFLGGNIQMYVPR
jgi:RHS repeat-associated protein